MTSPAPPPGSLEHGGHSEEQLAELRRLLFGREAVELEELRRRLDALEVKPEDVSRVLPRAIAIRAGTDQELDAALAPTIESAVRRSVKKNPRTLADAIFPVLGPAIRKSIAQTLSGMVQAMNKALEHSLSFRGLKWRVESMRSGVPFGEVVLRHTLVYRVEQAFLIHRETGLPLQHVVIDVEEANDPDLISSMMTAIQDFVSDSFQVKDGTGLQTFSVGDLLVRVEPGPHAVLAVVVRGHAPNALRVALQGTIEQVHADFDDALLGFEGDASVFETARPLLESCLTEQLTDEAQTRRRISPTFLAVATLAAVLIGFWGFTSLRTGSRWNRALDALRATPGIVVLRSGKRDGKRFVEGLRDPSAPSAGPVLAAAGFDSSRAVSAWEPFLSFQPAMVLARAERALNPPTGVLLGYDDGVLTAAGSAPRTWIRQARDRWEFLPGVTSLDESGLTDTDLRADIAQIEGGRILFETGSAALRPEERTKLDSVAARVARVISAGGRINIELLGRADSLGDATRNRELSRARAEVVQATLVELLGVTDLFRIFPLGTDDPVAASDPADPGRSNRSVSFRVVTSRSR